MKLLCFFCLSVALFRANAQQVEKIWFDKNDSTYGYYTVIKPASGRIQAALVLLDGYSGNASGFLTDTRLHGVAYDNDIITICIPTGLRLYADASMIDLLNTTLSAAIKNYHLRKDQFALGGFSAGGTIVLRYAELCKEQPANYPIQPAAVFTGDSPVDLLGLYQSSKVTLKKNAGWWTSEADMIIEKLDTQIGKPANDLANYRKISPFLYSDTLGNERWLKDVAYRTYHDVDVNWFIQNRKKGIYETNMFAASELVTRLVLLGNINAEFVSSKHPGYRNNGQRHPHSWNIIDEVDLVQWLQEKLHFYPDHLATPMKYEAPSGWDNETILFPIDFAPTLPYDGFEELRFAPGWGDAKSNEKWAYTIAWWLNDKYPFDENILRENLQTYFTGLTRRRAVADKLDMSAWFPAKAEVQKVSTVGDDEATWSGTIKIFDAQVTRQPGSLYVKIHRKKCSDAGKTILLFEIAGNAFNTPVWQQLDKVNSNFNCGAH